MLSANSPVGLAAWIVEKFQSWSDESREIESKFSRDDLLANVMLYWVTNSIVPSMRLYKEFAQAGFTHAHLAPISVPVGLSLFPHEIAAPSDRQIRRRFTNIVRLESHDVGGHFAALEHPDCDTNGSDTDNHNNNNGSGTCYSSGNPSSGTTTSDAAHAIGRGSSI